jgi:hypothetical protein
MRSGQVVDEDPTQLHQGTAALVPQPGPADRLDPASAPAVPGDLQGLPFLRAWDDLGGTGQVLSLDSRTPLARVLRRRLDQVGVGVEQADQGQPPWSLRGQLGQFMGRVAAVGSDDEGPIGEPSHQDSHHLTEQLGRCFVPSAQLQVVLLGSLERHQQGQGPASSRPGDFDQKSQDDPLMTPGPSRTFMTNW